LLKEGVVVVVVLKNASFVAHTQDNKRVNNLKIVKKMCISIVPNCLKTLHPQFNITEQNY